jgi:hypothetical protein
MGRWAFGALTGLVLLACGPADEALSTPARRDSLGIEIVESATPAWAAGAGWTIPAEPLLAIGVAEGDPNYVFDRIVGALRLCDGRMVVATGQSNQLRSFDSAGRFLRASGRTGAGPGEFRGLSWIGRLGCDSLLAWDRGNFRLTVVGPGGEYVRSAPMERPLMGFLNLLGLLPDRTLLASLKTGGEQDGVRRDTLIYLRYGMDGALLDTVGRLPGLLLHTAVTRRPDGRPASARMSVVPLTPYPRAVVTNDGFYYGAGDTYEIRQYSEGGALRRLIRRPIAPRTLTDAHVADYRNRYLASLRDDEARREQERRWREMPVPKTAPAYGWLGADDEGNLWVGSYGLPGDSGSGTAVFDPTGVLLGAVTMPRRFLPMHIGADFLLGVTRDEDELEYVRLYRLVKPGG